jgi:hypothetical protein
MLEEFGFAFGGDSKLMGSYLRANAASAFLAGANGFLYWCWNDFKTPKQPYQTTPMESSLGYVDTTGQPKIWSRYYDQFRNFVHKYSSYHPQPSGVVLYKPKNYNKGGSQADKTLSTAYLALVANGITPQIRSHISTKDKLIVVPYSRLTINEIKELNKYVSGGGHLIVTNINRNEPSQYWEKLTSTRMTDVAQNMEQITVDMANESIIMQYTHPIPVLKPISKQAKIIASSPDQIPMIIKTKHGKGMVVQFVGPIQNVSPPKYSRSYIGLWRKLLRVSGYKASVQISKPYVQSGIIENKQGDKKLLLINHLDKPQKVTVSGYGHKWDVKIPGQDFKVLSIK